MPADSKKTATARDIDRLVDEALRHPERAERVKSTLRKHVLGSDARVTPLRPAQSASLEDMWDNVPV
jgi:hypothetical protein